MRAMILPVAALLLAGTASLAQPAAAQGLLETGGISITRGGGNVNTAAGNSPLRKLSVSQVSLARC